MLSSMWLCGGLSSQLVTNGIMVTVPMLGVERGGVCVEGVLGAGSHLMDWDVAAETERALPQTQS